MIGTLTDFVNRQISLALNSLSIKLAQPFKDEEIKVNSALDTRSIDGLFDCAEKLTPVLSFGNI
jgi:hypothetical protein